MSRRRRRRRGPSQPRRTWAAGGCPEGPHEVEPDAAHDGAGQVEGGGHAAQRRVEQDHVGRLDGHVGAAADGHTEISLRQRRSVVDTVAHHGHNLARRLQRRHVVGLAAGRDAGQEVGDAEPVRQVADGPGVVARRDPDAEALRAEQGERGGRLRLEGVRQRQVAAQRAVDGQQHDGLALGLERRHLSLALRR
eukprot:scaffold8263_cov104-Isochrysis_galbana.AAC.12